MEKMKYASIQDAYSPNPLMETKGCGQDLGREERQAEVQPNNSKELCTLLHQLISSSQKGLALCYEYIDSDTIICGSDFERGYIAALQSLLNRLEDIREIIYIRDLVRLFLMQPKNTELYVMVDKLVKQFPKKCVLKDQVILFCLNEEADPMTIAAFPEWLKHAEDHVPWSGHDYITPMDALLDQRIFFTLTEKQSTRYYQIKDIRAYMDETGGCKLELIMGFCGHNFFG